MANGFARKRVLVLGSQARALVNFRGPLVGDLVAAGHSVTAAAPGFDRADRAAIEALGAKPVEFDLARTGMNPAADLATLMRLRRLLRAETPDLLVTSTIKPNVWGAFAARAENIESVAMVTGLGYAFTPMPDGSPVDRIKQRLAHRIASRLYRASTRFNSHVVFQNRDDAADFVAAGCLRDESKIVLTEGSGVDIATFAPTPLPDEPNVLMIARLLGNKGVREYARAAQIVKRDRPSVRFRLVGPTDQGPDAISASEMETWAATGLEYLGPRDDVRGAIADASICVLPSYREGTPRAILEAMAMGRPIVTSDAPGCRETVEEGKNGYLVPVRDSETLAERLKTLTANDAARRRMGDRSREVAVARYDVARVNARLIADLGLAA